MKTQITMPTEFKGIPTDNLQGLLHTLRMLALQSQPKPPLGQKGLEMFDYYDHLLRVKQSLDLANYVEWLIAPAPHLPGRIWYGDDGEKGAGYDDSDLAHIGPTD